jgi:hypothetical protein
VLPARAGRWRACASARGAAEAELELPPDGLLAGASVVGACVAAAGAGDGVGDPPAGGAGEPADEFDGGSPLGAGEPAGEGFGGCSGVLPVGDFGVFGACAGSAGGTSPATADSAGGSAAGGGALSLAGALGPLLVLGVPTSLACPGGGEVVLSPGGGVAVCCGASASVRALTVPGALTAPALCAARAAGSAAGTSRPTPAPVAR